MKVRRIDFYPDEFIAGVGGMAVEAIGMYWFVCSLIASSGDAISINDHRLSVLNCRADKRERIINSLVSVGKLTRNGDEIGNKRIQNEIATAEDRIQNSRTNGHLGGRPSKENNDLAKPKRF